MDKLQEHYEKFLVEIQQRHAGNVKYDLVRMQDICTGMGHPEQKLHGIHVAGTNGKGSVSALCERLSIVHGYKTGLNTSPHLVDYRERIRVSGRMIGRKRLSNLYSRWEKLLLANEASFFEITTALAFYHFHLLKVDTAVMEVGLGGRLDATNLFTGDVAVITTIAMDHPKSLGDTLEKIAAEKAGIIKPGKPVVVGQMPSGPQQVIFDKAAQMKSRVYLFDRDFTIANVRAVPGGVWFDYACPALGLNLPGIKVNLPGLHQARNAACAITAFYVYHQALGRPVDDKLVYRAAGSIRWVGRMQKLQSNPLVLIDGAHNEQAVTALLGNLAAMYPRRGYHIVLSILRDKQVQKMVTDLAGIAQHLYIAQNKSERAADIGELEDYARSAGAKYSVHDDVVSAYEAALKAVGHGELVLVTGSLYTISEVLARYTRQKKITLQGSPVFCK